MKFSFRTFLLQSGASLFIAFVIWLIAKQSDMDTSWVEALVVVENVPSNMVVTAKPEKVLINVQYPRDVSNRILAQIHIRISASQYFPENPQQWDASTLARTQEYKLTTSDLRKLFPSQSVQILDYDSPVILLTGKLLNRIIPIEITTTGTLPTNLTLTGPLRAEPPQVAVTGSREHLDRAMRAQTAPINLSQVRGSQQVFPKLTLPEGVHLIAGDDLQLAVDIGVTEKPVQRTVSNVPVTYLAFSGLTASVKPALAEVVIEGPASAVETIDADDISFAPANDLPEVPGKKYEVGIVARWKPSVPPEIQSQITIRECNPARITVEFTAPSPQNNLTPQ